MNLVVNVIACLRPNYLYVCLDSIYRNTIIPEVYVYIDKPENKPDCNKELLSVISEFPINGIFLNKEHKGVGPQFWYSFQQSFRLGYDHALYLEDDWLITSDAISWLYECPKICSLYSLYRWVDRIGTSDNATILYNGENLSWCVMMPEGVFNFIYNIYVNNLYTGLLHINNYAHQEKLYALNRCNTNDWDKILIGIADQYKLTQLVPSESLLAHFGNQTCIEFGYGGGSTENIENTMFNGNKEQWLSNIANIFTTYNKEQLENVSFRPYGFLYK